MFLVLGLELVAFTKRPRHPAKALVKARGTPAYHLNQSLFERSLH